MEIAVCPFGPGPVSRWGADQNGEFMLGAAGSRPAASAVCNAVSAAPGGSPWSWLDADGILIQCPRKDDAEFSIGMRACRSTGVWRLLAEGRSQPQGMHITIGRVEGGGHYEQAFA